MKPVKAYGQIIVLLVLTMAVSAQSTAERARDTPIGTGAVAPDFTLEDQSGRKVTLSDARGANPVVLVFYRGYW